MPEFRRFSSVLIDDILMIDPGPQVLDAMREFQKNPAAIKYIINTHKHSDHFCEQTVAALEALGAQFIEFSGKETKEIGKYKVSSYGGNHATCINTVHFMVTDTKRTIFYGLDGAWLMYDEVQAIKTYAPDLAVFDATIGDVDGDYRIFEHNNLNMILEIKKALHPYVRQFCISHMARTLHTDHKTLSARMKEKDILVAYDGLEIEV